MEEHQVFTTFASCEIFPCILLTTRVNLQKKGSGTLRLPFAFSINPLYDRISLKTFLPYKPGVGHGTSSVLGGVLKVSVRGTEQTTARYIYHFRRMGAEEFTTCLAFEELNLQEHADLLPIGNNLKCFVHEVKSELVGWVGDDVAVPMRVLDGKEVEYFVPASVV